MSDAGYVLIHRRLLGHHIFRNDSEALAFAWMIVKASWRPSRVRYKERSINLQRGQLSVSQRDMAQALDRDKAWVERLWKRLKNEAMIEVVSEAGVSVVTICNYDEFQLLSGSGEAVDEAGARQGRGRGEAQNNTRNTGNTFNTGDSNESPYTRDEPDLFGSGDQEEEPEKPKPKAKTAAKPKAKATDHIDRPEDVDEQVWADFLIVRDRKKAFITETALKGLRREADKAGWSLNDAIAKCVEKNWQGFDADWVGQGNGNGRNETAGRGFAGYQRGGRGAFGGQGDGFLRRAIAAEPGEASREADRFPDREAGGNDLRHASVPRALPRA